MEQRPGWRRKAKVVTKHLGNVEPVGQTFRHQKTTRVGVVMPFPGKDHTRNWVDVRIYEVETIICTISDIRKVEAHEILRTASGTT